jgi:hypothetical protein
MNVWLVKPEGFVHSDGLRHIAESFADAMGTKVVVSSVNPEEKCLVFGAHLLVKCNSGHIVYNTEQISSRLFEWYPLYGEILESHEVWDYSRLNIKNLRDLEIDARLVEIGFSETMVRPSGGVVPKDIDVLFYGSVNDRRNKILDGLFGKCKLHHVYGVYGTELDILIARSRVVLNMHYHDAGIHEIFRTSYLMANGSLVVTEVGRDHDLEGPWLSSMWFTIYDELVGQCLKACENYSPEFGENAHKMFSKRTQKQIIQEIGNV